MRVLRKEAPANSVPAAAVIRRVQALIGIIGRKGRVGAAFETAILEGWRRKRNSTCSGEMRRYVEEHLWRKRFSSFYLTLRRESKGSKQD